MAQAPNVVLSPVQQRKILRLVLVAKRRQLLMIEQELNARRFKTDDDVTEGAVLERINDCFIERKGLKAKIDAIDGTGEITFPTDDEIARLSAAVERLDHATLSTAATRDLISAANELVATFP